MAIRIEKKTVSVETTEVELRDIPFKEWPESMKQEAINILRVPHFKQQFFDQLECFRKDWLVARIENSVALQAEFSNDWMLK